MRALRWTVAITVIMALVSGTPALGQSAASADPFRVGGVTIQQVGDAAASAVPMIPDNDRAFYHEDGHRTEMTWASNDARLSGAVTTTGNRHYNRDGSMVEREVYTIVNEEGGWTGASTGLAAARVAPDPVIGSGLLPADAGHVDLVLLQGHGSYEGLAALLKVDWTQQPPVIAAAIVRGDLPALPALATIG